MILMYLTAGETASEEFMLGQRGPLGTRTVAVSAVGLFKRRQDGGWEVSQYGPASSPRLLQLHGLFINAMHAAQMQREVCSFLCRVYRVDSCFED